MSAGICVSSTMPMSRMYNSKWANRNGMDFIQAEVCVVANSGKKTNKSSARKPVNDIRQNRSHVCDKRNNIS